MIVICLNSVEKNKGEGDKGNWKTEKSVNDCL